MVDKVMETLDFRCGLEFAWQKNMVSHSHQLMWAMHGKHEVPPTIKRC